MLPNELDLFSWYVAKALGNNDALYWQKRLSLFDFTIVVLVKIYKACCLMTEVIFFHTDKGHGKDKVPKKFWVDYFFPFLLSRVLFILKKVQNERQRFFKRFTRVKMVIEWPPEKNLKWKKNYQFIAATLCCRDLWANFFSIHSSILKAAFPEIWSQHMNSSYFPPTFKISNSFFSWFLLSKCF